MPKNNEWKPKPESVVASYTPEAMKPVLIELIGSILKESKLVKSRFTLNVEHERAVKNRPLVTKVMVMIGEKAIWKQPVTLNSSRSNTGDNHFVIPTSANITGKIQTAQRI